MRNGKEHAIRVNGTNHDHGAAFVAALTNWKNRVAAAGRRAGSRFRPGSGARRGCVGHVNTIINTNNNLIIKLTPSFQSKREYIR
jgi:hypothetical protein